MNVLKAGRAGRAGRGHRYVAVFEGKRSLRRIDIHIIILGGFPVLQKIAIGMRYHRDDCRDVVVEFTIFESDLFL